MMQPSSSSHLGKHNPRLAEIRKAIRRDALTPDGLLPIEGPHLIEEARRSGLQIVELFLREGETLEAPAGQVHLLTDTVFRSIRATREPQGAIALVEPPLHSLESILSDSSGPWIILCGIQDPGNAGTILRLGEAFGSAGCIRTPGTVSLNNNKVVRASAGSVFRLPTVSIESLSATCELIRSRGIPILGTAADGHRPASDFDWSRPAAILFGREGSGLTFEERQLCDMILSIPHITRVESLNVASAAAILLYEAARMRNPKLREG